MNDRPRVWPGAIASLCLGALLLGQPADSVSAAEVARKTGESAQAFCERVEKALSEAAPPDTVRLLSRFILSYPEEISNAHSGPSSISLTMRSGAEVLFEDFQEKNYEQRLENPDLADTLFDAYPPAIDLERWPENLDPGRYRNDTFLKAVYGDSQAAVRDNLETVDFLGQPLPFNSRNGAAEALRRVARDLTVPKASNPERFGPYLTELGGTFNWRVIAGTNRLSAHSYGISIDLNPSLGGYWRWETGDGLSKVKFRRDYPAEIVSAFERQGFIWGGKWYHFDLMHFEYRPEFFASLEPPQSIGHASSTGSTPAPVSAPMEPVETIVRFSFPATGDKGAIQVRVEASNPPQWVIVRLSSNDGQETEIFRGPTLAGLAMKTEVPLPEPGRQEIERRFLTAERARVVASGGSVEEFDRQHFSDPIRNAQTPELRRFYESVWKEQPRP